MNIENINKVIEAIKADREKPVSHFTMGSYASIIDFEARPGDVKGYQVCNTAMCIAGWANTIRMLDINDPRLKTDAYFDYVGNRFEAAHWLGISDEDAKHMFFMENKDAENTGGQDALDAFDKSDRDARYNAAIAVLEHLRDTGNADWQKALRSHSLDEVADLIDNQEDWID